MTINELMTYTEVVESLRKKKRNKHLLFGNGFSMAYDKSIFSYNALSRFIEDSKDPIIASLFQKLNTKNFELIMQQLDNFCSIAEVFSEDKNLVPKIKTSIENLKIRLLDAVEALHPEHVFTIPDKKSKACFQFFLANGGLVFSSNYDLLLYWVLMRNQSKNAIDGFGRDLETDLDNEHYVDPGDLEFSELRWGKHKEEQTVYYLHGALPL